jgi:hypothetical protein
MAASPINDFKEFRLLVEVQGPFISSSVLRDTFPQGFPKEETLGDDLRELRIAYEMWQDASPAELSAQNDWIRYVLTNILEFDSSNIAVGQAIPQSLRVRSAEAHGDLIPDLLLSHA